MNKSDLQVCLKGGQEMAQEIEAPAYRPEDLSSISRTHMIEIKN